ncbi:hypothetical protein [Streptomyces europaeiscabiei]|uniref:hypothetical protein n=1 Tax=Streptomyces europaeiscabiei TaxID=146819 RepID=UPI0029BAF7B3|nr:hypothetical protein [Streptomyces europaeiscabiei]MDX2770883.1 hypothetical protein [Streptomyces europaeiscabiei]
MSEEPDLTAAQLVVTEPQPDDSGASTLDRYDWQAAMAAADGLKLYLTSLGAAKRLTADENCRILCEYHEDWVVLQGANAELVSGKHREPWVGPFTTINQLADEGGLAHLFLRWHALKKKPTCRLATTNGLASGEPQKLEAAIEGLRALRLAGLEVKIPNDHLHSVSKLHQAIRKYGSKYLPKTWAAQGGQEAALCEEEQRSETANFLSMLTIQVEGIGRRHVSFAAPSMYVKPVLEHLGFDVSPESVWNAVLGVFRTRMRAAGPKPDGALPPVLAFVDGSGPPGALEKERSLAPRLVTMQDIDLTIITAVANPSAYESLTSPIRLSRAAIKMQKGGCSDNSIERGEQLRQDFRKYWSARMSGDPTALADRERLRRLLLRISDQADTPAVRATDNWGPAFWERIQSIIEDLDSGKLPIGMDSDLLLGGISELANACQVWFSDRFDVTLEIDRLRERSKGSAA